MWLAYAWGSALFAGLTAILSKQGIRSIDSSFATALRTGVVLLFSWGMVFLVGSQQTIVDMQGRTLLFLVLSGIATGASWLCYFKALQLGSVSKVTPIDKSSTLLTMALAMLFLGEPFTWMKSLAMCLIGAGTWLMLDRGAAVRAGAANSVIATDNSGSRDKSSEQGKSGTQDKPGLQDKSTASNNTQITHGNWLPYAVGAAVFAALTAILGKIGIQGVESNLGTAIRTIVVLIMAWVVVLTGRKNISLRALKRRDILFLVLSGMATGGSWLCYYKALQDGPASIVVPIDKLSIVLTIAFSRLFLNERQSGKALFGLTLIVAGTLALLVK